MCYISLYRIFKSNGIYRLNVGERFLLKLYIITHLSLALYLSGLNARSF